MQLSLIFVFDVLEALGITQIRVVVDFEQFFSKSKPRGVNHNKLMAGVDYLSLLVCGIFQVIIGASSLGWWSFGFFICLVCNICQLSS